MTDGEHQEPGEQPNSEEFEVQTPEDDDLDAAMRDALEAVERSEAEGDSESAGVGQAVPGAILADLEGQIAGLKERSVRTLADFENYRRRAERERAESKRYEGFGLLAELLPLLDNLGRALDAAGEVEDLKLGVELIARQFQDLLRRHGVERVAAKGAVFDPMVHDAVSREEDPEIEVATVAEELQPGYTMGERLLRPASVRVAVPKEAPAEQAASDSAASNEGSD